jgi:rare lipoprotein A
MPIAPQGAAAMSATVLPPSPAPAIALRGASPLIGQTIPQDGSAAAVPAGTQRAYAEGTPAAPQGVSGVSAPPIPPGPSAPSVPVTAGVAPVGTPGGSAERTPAGPHSAAAVTALDLLQGAAAALSAPAAAAETTPQQRALFVQAGAFTDAANAERLAAKLQSGGYGKIFVRDDMVAGRRMYRVRIGPVPDVPEFDRIVAALDQAGVHDARLAFD